MRLMVMDATIPANADRDAFRATDAHGCHPCGRWPRITTIPVRPMATDALHGMMSRFPCGRDPRIPQAFVALMQDGQWPRTSGCPCGHRPRIGPHKVPRENRVPYGRRPRDRRGSCTLPHAVPVRPRPRIPFIGRPGEGRLPRGRLTRTRRLRMPAQGRFPRWPQAAHVPCDHWRPMRPLATTDFRQEAPSRTVPWTTAGHDHNRPHTRTIDRTHAKPPLRPMATDALFHATRAAASRGTLPTPIRAA